jgi:GNAT superfamily N-acetyltransferase
MIRAAAATDGPVLREIEVAAGARFATVGLAEVAAHDPFSIVELEAYRTAGRSWVATGADGTVVGYAVADDLDGCAHLEQVSVRPEQQGRGIGRELVEAVVDWARACRCPAVTLTTFADVPWNAPLYEHLGFRVLSEPEIGPELAARRDEETAFGLDPARRVCMRRDLR